MYRCLSISEILRSVCDKMDKASSLSIALTCRAFLEPGFDKVWLDILVPTFEPLICCLPDDIWQSKDDGLLALRVPLTLEHLERYLTFYAPRIRSVSTSSKRQGKAISLETIESLKLEPGDDPLYFNAVLFNARQLRLRELKLWPNTGGVSTTFTFGFIPALPWDSLEKIYLDSISTEIIYHLAKIPRLRVFEICDMDATLEHLPDLDLAEVEDNAPNKLERVKASCWVPNSWPNPQMAINAIEEHCNPLTLLSVEVFDNKSMPGCLQHHFFDHYPDSSPRDVDFSGLQRFTKLQTVTVHWSGNLRLSPSKLSEILEWWPCLQHLDLCTGHPCRGQMPALDHTHLLELLRRCPSLRFLGLRFDTTQLRPGDDTQGATETFRLETLRVGESPICSLFQVATFIRKYFPTLKKLDMYYVPEADAQPSAECALLNKRWAAVVQALRL
ncbi:hypothetical protein FA13DRAFT_1709068 [Coprinellus micaceus]|uniref:F-box domain-containing protein n=1 Tax=Coprinellus micaceus TaxID=71717 RepID=A0A4Y7TG88_COPMI|nr:hypothetical protein FA13DRAFT_1709068 [Coprinellus micaceus]